MDSSGLYSVKEVAITSAIVGVLSALAMGVFFKVVLKASFAKGAVAGGVLGFSMTWAWMTGRGPETTTMAVMQGIFSSLVEWAAAEWMDDPHTWHQYAVAFIEGVSAGAFSTAFGDAPTWIFTGAWSAVSSLLENWETKGAWDQEFFLKMFVDAAVTVLMSWVTDAAAEGFFGNSLSKVKLKHARDLATYLGGKELSAKALQAIVGNMGAFGYEVTLKELSDYLDDQ